MKKFTASEVRTQARLLDGLSRQMLNRFADRLEADKKAEAVELDYYDAGHLNDFGGGNVSWWWDYIRGELGRAHSFYQSQVNDITSAPADAERLAEALRELSFAAQTSGGVAGHDAGLVAAIDNAAKALTAHSAQAQPPAASVLDGVNQGLLIGTSPDGRPYAMRGTPESVAVVSAMLEHAGTSQQLTMESGNG